MHAGVGCGGAGLHRAEYSVSLGADGAGGVRSSCLRAQRASRTGRCGRAAGPRGMVTAGRDMGRAGVALGLPEGRSPLPGPRPEAAAGLRRKVTVGPGGRAVGGGLRRNSGPS